MTSENPYEPPKGKPERWVPLKWLGILSLVLSGASAVPLILHVDSEPVAETRNDLDWFFYFASMTFAVCGFAILKWEQRANDRRNPYEPPTGIEKWLGKRPSRAEVKLWVRVFAVVLVVSLLIVALAGILSFYGALPGVEPAQESWQDS